MPGVALPASTGSSAAGRSPGTSLRPANPVGATVAEVAERAGATAPSIEGRTGGDRITGITLRAQDVRRGDLFAAIAGSRVHGATFGEAAAAAGAAAFLTDPVGARLLRDAEVGAEIGGDAGRPVLVVDDPRRVLGTVASSIYGDPSSRLDVVGVTGTSGKTTTCYLLEAALGADGSTTGLVGTVQTRIAGQVAPSALTTPEAPDLQALFAVMVERGVEVVAMEVSSHALAQHRVSGTAYAVGAFTNLSLDHLDFHHDMDSYFEAKAMLFDGRSARHVICVDEEWGTRLARLHPDAVRVSGSNHPGADWAATGVRASPSGVQQVVVRGPGGLELAFDLGLPAAFNVTNAVLALACVNAIGRDVTAAAAALGRVSVPGRLQRIDAGQDFLAVVDYAHKPAALAAVIDAIRGSVAGRIVVVVGAGGDRDTGKRPVMGAEAARRADVLIVTDDNPRSEDPARIRAELLAGARAEPDPRSGLRILEIGDRREAIREAIRGARRGDAVIIAGKGHEQGQDVGGVIHPFSDAGEVAAALDDLVAGADA